MLKVGRAGTAVRVERIVRGWRRVDRKAEARAALLLKALDAARETLYQQTRGQEAATQMADSSLNRPTRAQQQADALALLAETALRHGIDPGAPGERYNARTTCPGWLGERLDVGWAIDVLHPRARRRGEFLGQGSPATD